MRLRLPPTRWVRAVLWVLGVVVAVLTLLPLLGTSTSRVGPGEVAIGFRPSAQGRTTLALPPLGRLSAATHTGPVELRLELRSLDVASLLDESGRADTGAVADRIREDLPRAVRDTVVRSLVVAALVGSLAAAVLPHRRLRTVSGGALLGAVTAGALMASTLPGFDSSEFDEVTFQGSLSSGTRLLDTVTGGRSSPVGQRLDTLSDKLAGLYSSTMESDVVATEGETVILHISDLHLNPLGVELARRLATSFDVDAVIDTGDTTSFGTPFEGRFADLIGDFGVPYYYVAGNHDSLANRAAISAAPGVTSIDRRIVRVGPVRILGFDDPVVTTAEHVERAERERIEAEAAPELQALVDARTPDLVAVHNPVILRDVVGTTPVAIAGHIHRFELGASKGTVLAVVGSTGATGLGSLLSESDQPYAAQVLRFSGRDLVAVDQVEVVGTSGDLVVRRHVVTAADRDADDADFIGRDVEEGSGAGPPTTDPAATTGPDATGPDATSTTVGG